MNSYSSLHAFSNLVDTFLYCGDWGGQIGTALFSLVPRLLRSYLHSSLGMRLSIITMDCNMFMISQTGTVLKGGLRSFRENGYAPLHF